MMVKRTSLLILSLLGGCNKQTPPANDAPTTSTTKGEPSAPTLPVKPPLLMVEVSNIVRDWEAATALIPADSEMANLRGLPLENLLPILIGQGLAAHVRFDRPIDVGVFSENLDSAEQEYVFIAELSEPADALMALAQDFTFESMDTGAYRLTPNADFKASFFETRPTCDVWDRGEDVGYLTCGDRAQYSDAQGELLVRQRKAHGDRATADAVRLTFRGSTFADEVAQAGSPTASAAERFGGQLVLDAFNDIKTLGAGLSPDGQGLIASLEFDFSGKRSVISSVLLGSEPAALEDVFFRLPQDSQFAVRFSGMSRGDRKEDVHELFKKFFELAADKDFQKEGIAPITASFEKLLLTGGPGILAVGLDPTQRQASLEDFLEITEPVGSDLGRLREESAGWFLIGLKEPSKKWMADFAEMHEIDVRYSKLTHKDQQQKSAHPSPNGPSVTPTAGKATTDFIWRATVPGDAPQGTHHYVLETIVNPEFPAPASNEGYPPFANQQHVLLYGVGEYTWICGSPRVNQCAAYLRALATGKGKTLAGHPLEKQLKKARGTMVGFTSVEGIAVGFLDDETRSEHEESLQTLKTLANASDTARAPFMFVGGSRTPEGGRGETLRIEAQISLEKVAALFSLDGEE